MSKSWKKGALHTHTMWSDGRSLPEVALKSYRDAGFDFVCLSDHNIVPEDENAWLQLAAEEGPWPPCLSWKEVERSESLLPENSIIKKRISYRWFVRLKTFAELQKEWEIPGKFLVIPGEEVTTIQRNFGEENRKYDLHFNAFNINRTIPEPEWDNRTDHELTRDILAAYNEVANDESFVMAAHPFAYVWDVDPRLLMDFPEIKVCEICNSGTSKMPENWIYERERYWDFVLAHRIDRGYGMIYGTATDDAHFYDPDRMDTPCAYNCAWVMVNCPDEFSPGAIREAILNGDFYSSCGVELDDVVFDNRTLKVKVKAAPGVKYRIDFISTGKDFDRSLVEKVFMHEDEPYSRKRPVMPDSVGVTVKSVDGTEAEYTMSENDMYIRAVIVSDQPSRLDTNFFPKQQTAWTQPFC